MGKKEENDSLEQVSLARQVDLVLEQLASELKGLSAGTIVIQVRNDEVGKFGIRHLPVMCGEKENSGTGMSSEQVRQLRRMAVEALQHKRGWTHGEISYDFALRQGEIYASVQFESNYNMANILFRVQPKQRDRKDVSNK
ncbi:O-methyltransferase [Cohnella pontilimi]|uniref:O-methyltransferase n=1 Tax=Cohnella pontilimi TaxID=2564100 RepID=A0A4U0F9M5_9BACL|nr:O-methyltransferase [Cohnella pontilimi]TJY39822.1 O-methyltransferase [Cohnella pontilimi]